MFIAHLPAGYLATRLGPRVPTSPFLVGSVLPDLDLVLVYGFGIAQHHHSFLTHRPALWLGVLLLGMCLRLPGVATLGCGALLHVALDSVAGQIAWLWPLSDVAVPLVDVPARYDLWMLNFLLHWTALVEAMICACAAVALVKRS